MVYLRKETEPKEPLIFAEFEDIGLEKHITRQVYDKELLRLAMVCLKTLSMNVTRVGDIKSMKELAGALEVLTRTVYKVLDVAVPKDADFNADNSNIDRLVEMLRAGLNPEEEDG